MATGPVAVDDVAVETIVDRVTDDTAVALAARARHPTCGCRGDPRRLGGGTPANLGARPLLNLCGGLQMRVGSGLAIRPVLVRLAANSCIVYAVKVARTTFPPLWTCDMTDVEAESC